MNYEGLELKRVDDMYGIGDKKLEVGNYLILCRKVGCTLACIFGIIGTLNSRHGSLTDLR